jgi:hypothetical protein
MKSIILYLSILLHIVYVYQSPLVMQQIIFPPPLSLKTQHVSTLDGHLQVSQYVETATLHQCSSVAVSTY